LGHQIPCCANCGWNAVDIGAHSASGGASCR
jgi:hypothetical protein